MKRRSAARPAPHPVGLGRRVDRNENDIRRLDAAGHVGRKMQVPTARLPHDLVEPRLIDWQRRGIPRGNARGIHVDDLHFDLGGLEGDHRHRRPTHVTGANTADFHALRWQALESCRV